MITEEMLREAAHKASEVLTAYYERDQDPQKQYEIPPEFEKRIQDLIDGKMPGRLNALRRFIKRLSHYLRVPKRQQKAFIAVLVRDSPSSWRKSNLGNSTSL